jgi:hypothetical protein
MPNALRIMFIKFGPNVIMSLMFNRVSFSNSSSLRTGLIKTVL